MDKFNDIYKKYFIIFILIQILILSFNKYHSIFHSNSKQIILTNNFNNNMGYNPKVLYFDKLWNGYKYWMIYSSYINSNKSKDNAIINASNDLIHWIKPKGIKNPFDIPKLFEYNYYNSDSYLLFNKNTNELEVFWRNVNILDNEVNIYVQKSKDGINWSQKEIFIKSFDRIKQDYVSPSILYEKNIYKIWYIHINKIFYIEYNQKDITNPRILDIYFENNYIPYNIDVIFNQEKKLYELIISGYIGLNIKNAKVLLYSSSEDNIFWNIPIKILEPSKRKLKFDSEGFYRSSLVYVNKEYYLFYSGQNQMKNVGIGLMYGKNITNLKPFL